jgi:IS605 OrfB family transposase
MKLEKDQVELKRGQTFQLKPRVEQKMMLGVMGRSLKFVWNVMNRKRIQAYTDPKSPQRNYRIEQAELTHLRREDVGLEFVPVTASQNTLRALDKAWKAYPQIQKELERKPHKMDKAVAKWAKREAKRQKRLKEGTKPSRYEEPLGFWLEGRPQFKRKSDPISLGFSITLGKTPFVKGGIVLPRLGLIKCNIHRDLWGECKTVTLKPDGDRWVVSISYRTPVRIPNIERPLIAIDLGVVSTISDSDGRQSSLPEEVLYLEAKIDRAKARNDLKKVEGKSPSKNWHRGNKRINRRYRRLTNIRKQWIEEESKFYATHYGVVVFEELQIQKMTESGEGDEEDPGEDVKDKAKLNRSILRQSWGTFIRKVSSKAEASGAQVVVVQSAYSSQTCSAPGCGYCNKGNRLGRIFRCLECGHTEDADLNAAKVLRDRFKPGEFEVIGGHKVKKKLKLGKRKTVKKERKDPNPQYLQICRKKDKNKK